MDVERCRCHKPINLFLIGWLVSSQPWQFTLLMLRPVGWFNIKMTFYQYRKFHCGDKTVVRLVRWHVYIESGPRIFQENQVMTMTADALDPCIAGHHHSWYEVCKICSFVFNEEGFKLVILVIELIQNVNEYMITFSKKTSVWQGWCWGSCWVHNMDHADILETVIILCINRNCVSAGTVWCCYNTVNFLKNPHNRCHIFCPQGRDMGYLFGT